MIELTPRRKIKKFRCGEHACHTGTGDGLPWTPAKAVEGVANFFPSDFFRWVVFPRPKQPHSTNFCKSRVCGTAYGVVNSRVASEWVTSSDGRRQRRRQVSEKKCFNEHWYKKR